MCGSSRRRARTCRPRSPRPRSTRRGRRRTGSTSTARLPRSCRSVHSPRSSTPTWCSPGDWRWCCIRSPTRWPRLVVGLPSTALLVVDVNARPAVIADRSRLPGDGAGGARPGRCREGQRRGSRGARPRTRRRVDARGGRPCRGRDVGVVTDAGGARGGNSIGRGATAGRPDRRHDRCRRHVHRRLHGGLDGRRARSSGPRRRRRPRPRRCGPSGPVMLAAAIVVTRHGADPPTTSDLPATT